MSAFVAVASSGAPLPSPGATPSQKDRFLAFAFTAADLLIEAAADGTILFASGAFTARFDQPPEAFVGRHMRRLFCPADRQALDLAVSTTAMRGRIPPTALRLSDRHGTAMSLSGLASPTAEGRLCFTLGRVPVLPAAAEAASNAIAFAQLAEAQARSEDSGGVGLLEVANWDATRLAMPIDAQRALQSQITGVLQRLAGPGAVAGELADGRFGVLSQQPPDMQMLAHALEAVLHGHAGTAHAQVQSAGLTLDRGGLTGAQAARALRFALTRFASGGTEATDAAGFRNGLADFISSAEIRARAVRSAIAGNRFRMAYQPIADLATRATHHYEALLRPIFTPGLAIQNTQDFVTFAEAVGLSEELDWAVMQQVVKGLADCPGASAAVNVSGLSMQSPRFREQMLGLLESETKVAGRMLVELTETADIEDTVSAQQSIDGLRAIGVPVCIDDFGAGSATFRYLKEFKVDFVKLDGFYVRGALHNARERGFLISMIELANLVGAKVIAETIETEPEAELMRELGVEFGQGWLFGRPGTLPSARKA